VSSLERFENPAELSQRAGAEFVALARAAIVACGRFTVALSGGSTPRRLYGLLAAPPLRDAVDWGRVEFFWGDERAVPPEHPDSNYGAAAAALLDKIGATPSLVHRMRGEDPDLDRAARDYQLTIARRFGVDVDGPPPALDLILLGMGPDGHTASLFPLSPALEERRRWVVRNHAARLGTDRITLTVPILNQGRDIRLLVTGADKAETLKAVLEGPVDPERLPVQLIAPTSGRLRWLLDRAAAADLKGGA
jgi:6-phosphogluconolactonase